MTEKKMKEKKSVFKKAKKNFNDSALAPP